MYCTTSIGKEQFIAYINMFKTFSTSHFFFISYDITYPITGRDITYPITGRDIIYPITGRDITYPITGRALLLHMMSYVKRKTIAQCK